MLRSSFLPMVSTRRTALAVLLALAGTFGIAQQVSASSRCGDAEVAGAGDAARCIHEDSRADLIAAGRRPLVDWTSDGQPIMRSQQVRTAAASGDPALICDSTADVHRVEVLYAYTNSNNRLSERRGLLDEVIALAQFQYDFSAQVHGADRSYIPRFVTEAAGANSCRAKITAVKVNQSDLEHSNPAVFFDALENAGFDDLDRTYLVLVETESTSRCGLGSSYTDDDPSPSSNLNNQRQQAAFSRVDKWCWGLAEAHELGHNLGAVQYSAPNATEYGHCTDGYDTMCYRDGSFEANFYEESSCPDRDLALSLDCNGDDYYNPAPASGSYLDTHWNIVDSDWLLESWLGATEVGGTVGASGTLFDDVGVTNRFLNDIFGLVRSGVSSGCGTGRFCPTDGVTRGQMAAFLDRALNLPNSNRRFEDTTGHRFEASIAALAKAGITRGCNPGEGNTRFCPDAVVTRGQMAAFLDRALDLADSNRTFDDTSGHRFESSIAALAKAGITRGCNPSGGNTLFCPDEDVTRQQMAAFLGRAGLTD